MVQKIRDSVMAKLKNVLPSEQLDIVDRAVRDALKGYKIEVEETLPDIVDNSYPEEIVEYLARMKCKGLAPGTIEQYTIVLKQFWTFIRPKALTDVKDIDIITFLEWYETSRGISQSRKKGLRQILACFYSYMRKSGKILCDPMNTVDNIRVEKNLRVALTDIELYKIRQSVNNSRDKAIIEFLFATGCRVSEVVALDRDDVDLNSKQLKVRGKGNKERIVFLSTPAVMSLRDYFATRKDDSPALFVGSCAPHDRLSKAGIERMIRQLGEKAGLNRRIHPHLFRHACATHLLGHGMPIDQVQVYLGHESVDTTRIYAKTDKSQLHATYNRIMCG